MQHELLRNQEPIEVETAMNRRRHHHGDRAELQDEEREAVGHSVGGRRQAVSGSTTSVTSMPRSSAYRLLPTALQYRPHMQVGPGTRLGPYEIVSQLGAGGMGEVWRAKDTRLDRSVAVKILPATLAQNAQFRMR